MLNLVDLLLAKRDFSLRDDYTTAIWGVQKHLVQYTAANKYLFLAELTGSKKDMKPKMVMIELPHEGYRNLINS